MSEANVFVSAQLEGDVREFSEFLEIFCDSYTEDVLENVRGLLPVQSKWYALDDINQEIGLRCLRLLPEHPFVEAEKIDELALLYAQRRTWRDLIQTSVLIRLLSPRPLVVESVWDRWLRYLIKFGHGGLSETIARSLLVEMAGDVVVYNGDIATRLDSAEARLMAERVIEDLKQMPLANPEYCPKR
ncbi:MAG: hypothetical protein Q8Q09_10360 [Deltaproteobacteria bacterium]|nr:hypothetical protein [Deltaproteobacteria bacterium]